MSEEEMTNQPSHSRESRDYTIRRSAPPPPKFSRNTTPTLKYVNDISSDFVYIRYTNIEHGRNTNTEDFSTGNTHECLISIINKLIDKEQLFVLTLKSLIQRLELVSTAVCNKLPLLRDIFEFHTKTLLKEFFESTNPLHISNLFQKYKMKLDLYVIFVSQRKDFSYLVMDLCDVIIDHFKARLLEYNFTISQIKNVCINNLEIKISCNDAEDVVKHVYQRINFTIKDTESQEQ